ncbi:MAG: 23S rRNA (adenine(2503)-C(2))-methyltransferase RlmN [Mycoplasmataceae bacterium]|jgi:23S rRNA (adenine2503-C2)-methyltransferase|nr:23S rRNA (adenine(2503)-C(2))-methyltransferase RlmN [Mycoplasmataceae bacterium]
MESIYNYTLEELEQKFVALEIKKFNAKQVYKWVYEKLCTDFDVMSNLSKATIAILKNNFDFNYLQILETYIDPDDETTKFLLETNDKQRIETVIMKFNYGYSICISTQVGCNMGCKFCASGLLKKIRDLSTCEMVLQIITANQYLKKHKNAFISNVVVMGIGEPLDNYENLKRMLKIINEPFGLKLGSRKVTVSTCGLANKILTFAKDFPQTNLAISLHASNDTIRNKIMPIAAVYNIPKLLHTLHEYSAIVNRRITIEYLLLKDINDSSDCAMQLASLLKDLNCYVNLINYNNVSDHNFTRSTNSEQFAKILIANHINTTTRLERGLKINASCGQLRANYEKK